MAFLNAVAAYHGSQDLGLSFNESVAERWLSPSDFGFHNILKDRNGWLVFLDF